MVLHDIFSDIVTILCKMETVVAFIFYFCNEKNVLCFHRIEIKSCKKKKIKIHIIRPDSIPLIWNANPPNFTCPHLRRRENESQTLKRCFDKSTSWK